MISEFANHHPLIFCIVIFVLGIGGSYILACRLTFTKKMVKEYNEMIEEARKRLNLPLKKL